MKFVKNILFAGIFGVVFIYPVMKYFTNKNRVWIIQINPKNGALSCRRVKETSGTLLESIKAEASPRSCEMKANQNIYEITCDDGPQRVVFSETETGCEEYAITNSGRAQALPKCERLQGEVPEEFLRRTSPAGVCRHGP